MSEDDVFVEFLANFGDKNRDGTITREDWNDYFAAISFNMKNDHQFVNIMK